MRNLKFRVWQEFELEGEEYKEMAEPSSWFLLSQAGRIMSYGPNSFNPNAEREHKKLVPLFYTGLTDSKGEEIYEGDIVETSSGCRGIITYKRGVYCSEREGCRTLLSLIKNTITIIGNIYENPELFEGGK